MIFDYMFEVAIGAMLFAFAPAADYLSFSGIIHGIGIMFIARGMRKSLL